MDSTGGWVWVAYSVHVDAVTGAHVLFQAGCEGFTAYVLPPEDYARAAAGDLYALSWDIECERSGDNAADALRIMDGDIGTTPGDYVNAAAMKFWQAAELLNAETMRIYGAPLEDGQRDALRDASQAFGMLDDMAARMGLEIADALARVTDAHDILRTLSPTDAHGIHEAKLCLEYAAKMSRPRELGGFGLQTFGSAEEVQCEHAADSAIHEWCALFCERWHDVLSGIDAAYNGEREEDDADSDSLPVDSDAWCAARVRETDAERAPAAMGELDEMGDECARLRAENAALREAYATIHDATHALRAAVADANDALHNAGVL
jgi:hypothetical protein